MSVIALPPLVSVFLNASAEAVKLLICPRPGAAFSREWALFGVEVDKKLLELNHVLFQSSKCMFACTLTEMMVPRL